MKEKVYYLKKDPSHLNDSGCDAFHIPFKDDNRIGARMMGIRDFDAPESIVFQGDLRILSIIDLPITDLGIFIVSCKLVDVLIKIGSFKYRLIPVIMVDDTYPHELFNAEGKLKNEIRCLENFYALQILEYTEVFDYANSQYEMSLAFPEDVGVIYRLVLKDTEESLPPIFRLKECSRHLFVTEKTKLAIQKAEIKGCIFEEIIE